MGAADSKPEDGTSNPCPSPSPSSFSSPSSPSPSAAPINPPSAPSTPATPFASRMKSHLLNLLFDAIDVHAHSYIDRTEVLDFLHHEPYLSTPHIQPPLTRVLTHLQHDEDSHCSRHEFHAAFHPFPPYDITRLVVNLVRAIPLPGRRLHHTLTLLETQLVRQGGEGEGEGEGQGQGGDDAPAVTFLLDMLFHAIDQDLDALIEPAELDTFLSQDAFFTADDALGHTLRQLHAALKGEGEGGKDEGGKGWKGSEGGLTITSRISGSGIDQQSFVTAFTPLGLAGVDRLFLHLLTRSTSATLTNAGNAMRRAHRTPHRQLIADAAQHVPTHSQHPCQLVHGGKVRHSPTFPSPPLSPREGVVHGVRLTLLGQSMIQHDLRLTPYGQHTLHTIPSYLTADLIFSELETSILPSSPPNPSSSSSSSPFPSPFPSPSPSPPPAPHPLRSPSTPFFHSAKPEVIDVLVEMGINCVALANNHVGDMGKEGVEAVVEEVRKRGLVGAGVGMDLAQATAPAYLTLTPQCWQGKEAGAESHAKPPTLAPSSLTPPPPPTSSPSPPQTPSLPSLAPSPLCSTCPPTITVALVAHASKIPPGTAATPTSPGVNSLAMSDLSTLTLSPPDVLRILTSVSSARSHASIVIAYQHNHYWTGSGKVNEAQALAGWKRDWAHALVDSGATVYVSHGDPRMQGIEVYRGCPLFYCLGSFLFQTKTDIGFYGPEVWQSCIATLEYHTSLTDPDPPPPPSSPFPPPSSRPKAERTAPLPSPTFAIRLTPLTLNEVGVPAAPADVHLATRGLPQVARGEEGRTILRYVEEMSREFGTRVEIEEGEDGLVVGWVMGGGNPVKQREEEKPADGGKEAGSWKDGQRAAPSPSAASDSSEMSPADVKPNLRGAL